MRISRSRFDRVVRSLGAQAVEFERKDVPAAAAALVLPVVAVDGTGVPLRGAELEGRAGRQADGDAARRSRQRRGRDPVRRGEVDRECDAKGLRGHEDDLRARHLPCAREASGRPERDGDGRPPRRKAACDRLKDLIRAGNAVLASEEPAPYGRRDPAVAEFVRDCRPNLYRMRDDESRRRGMPCGSGVIEGGCRTVVVDRLKTSGSRWSIDGANGIMAIRCGWMNNRIVDCLQWQAAA